MTSRITITGAIAGAALLLGAAAWAPGAAREAQRGPDAAARAGTGGAETASAWAPRAAWAPQDPADSLYRAAREAVNAGEYRTAAERFGRVHREFHGSTYVPDALYWHAFSLYRLGGSEELGEARRLLDRLAQEFPDHATQGDAEHLLVRVRGALARTGDADAAMAITAIAESATRAAMEAARLGLEAAAEVLPEAMEQAREAMRQAREEIRSGIEQERRRRDCPEDELRLAALNALHQLDPDRALPLLQETLARRDDCSIELRRKAIFILADQGGPEAEEILLRVAREDPAVEVRRQAVFWLSEVPTDEAVDALEQILGSRDADRRVREHAIFALAQHESDRAGAILRRIAGDRGVEVELRDKAIHWIGQEPRPGDAEFLRQLFARLEEPELKEQVLFAVAEMDEEADHAWLLEVAGDERQTIEVRKKALFWAGESDMPVARLTGLYDRIQNRELKEQLIFVYSQRDEREAIDKLIEIVREEEDMELKRKALFWIGESDDPRVVEILQELLRR